MYGETVSHAVVLGGGSFGTALAAVLGQKHDRVTVWTNEADVAPAINAKHENAKYLPGVSLSSRISATLDLATALADAELVVIAVPSGAVRSVVTAAKSLIVAKATVVCAAKGIEVDTLALMSDVCTTVLGRKDGVAFLSGPSFAREVAEGLPTNVLIAGDEKTARRAQLLVALPTFRCYTSQDVIGVEIAGALKNVYAIASGCIEGMGLGLNARAALITRGLNEMVRMGTALGADPITFAGLAGVGDLVLTCTGALSRNRQLGFLLGQGRSLDSALTEVRTVAEGVPTAKALHALAKKHGLELPIAERIYSVLYDGLDVGEALRQLMARDLKAEWA